MINMIKKLYYLEQSNEKTFYRLFGQNQGAKVYYTFIFKCKRNILKLFLHSDKQTVGILINYITNNTNK